MEQRVAKREERILEFWNTRKIFEKSVSRRKGKRVFSFYDGPPFATGQPHYGHILATTIKDAVLRYRSMRGYRVPRRVGWDCHGLPVENLIEKELGLKDKREIEKLGIEKFNDACRASVFRCVEDFQNVLKRVGRWADYKQAYATMDPSYIESVWWVFQRLDREQLVYKDYRVSPYCPRCGTTLSNFEVSQGYKDVEDESVYVKFRISSKEFLKKHELPANTSFVAWTTTPWTLPGNVGLAVDPAATYVALQAGEDVLVVAKERLEGPDKVLEGPVEVLNTFKGKELCSVRYVPIFDAMLKAKPEGIENAFQVLPAKFVTMDEGTGIVHTAVMYGEDDFKLGKEYGLPMHHTVDQDGCFTEDVAQFAGRKVKETEKEIIAFLAQERFLVRQERIMHSYPFCWRCDTALLYYATESWYVRVTGMKKQLLANNKNIHWVPAHLKQGRFGEWLKEARDWAVSRSRYWGSPIPIWECDSCGKRKVLGSVKELLRQEQGTNTLYVLRHGHSERQVNNTVSSWPEPAPCPLTAKGVTQVKALAKKLKTAKIDVIVTSDLERTMQTAEIVGKIVGIEPVVDKRLREYNSGVFNGKDVSELGAFWSRDGENETEHYLRRFEVAPPKGETYVDVQKRLAALLNDLRKKHKNKNILLVSHELPLTLLEGLVKGMSRTKVMKFRKLHAVKIAELRQVPFTLPPLNKQMEVDLHRPYIDDVVFSCRSCKGKMKRVPEVFDCWFESGSMPYAQWHYPFENKKFVEQTFPADFIAEGLDQTRGWFYTLHVLATALTRRDIGLGKSAPAFKNVIVNGLVLDAEGKKLSKRLKNYPEVTAIFETYGADALRYFLLSSTPIGEDYRFSEEKVRDVWRKVVSSIENSMAFFELYKEKGFAMRKRHASKSLLDQWILARLNATTAEMTTHMEAYDLTKASRPVTAFVEELSNWYIRRSRTRFQQPEHEMEKEEAAQTLATVLFRLSKIIAPFMPFLAEEVYLKLRRKDDVESVHLADWPKTKVLVGSKALETQMDMVRMVIAKGLALRSKSGIKVRQPLSVLRVKGTKTSFPQELVELVQEEVNVKEVVFDAKLREDVALDTELTPALKLEGMAREIVRHVQEMRKHAGYRPEDRILLWFTGDEEMNEIFRQHKGTIMKIAGVKDVREGDRPSQVFDVEQEVSIEGHVLWMGIRKRS